MSNILASKGLTLKLLSNPLNLQQIVLDSLQEALKDNTGEDLVIVDPNSAAMHIIEMGTNLTANFSQATEAALSSQYALRAQTATDLYKHMSDFDYVNLFSTPATADIILSLDKGYLLQNAKDYNQNYQKVIIPVDTAISVGSDLTFGLFYPIEIRINKTTKTPIVLYDTDTTNPLQKLSQNILKFYEYSYMGIDLLQITIPIYQFTKSKITETFSSTQGFIQRYSYTDKFFAVRIFTVKNGQTIELHQTLTDTIYDPYVPTAKVLLEPDTSKFTVSLPQIYFTNNQLGTKLILELYTTKGNIDTNISGISTTPISINYNLTQTSSEYSQVLSKMPTTLITPVSDKLTGGSNGLTFEEIRTRTINNSFHTSALVTPIDVSNYFQDKGIRAIKYQDDLTNLIYFGYKILTDSTGSIIPATNSDIEITESITNTCSTIKKNLDGSLTILPTTLYTYNDSSLTCTPVTDLDRNHISLLSREEQINLFNTNTYTRSPFHIRLIPDGRSSYASSYNLMNPTISNFIFERDNDTIASSMVCTGGAIYHKNEGSGGFQVRFLVLKSSDLLSIPEEDITIYIYTKDTDNLYIGIKAKHIEATSTSSTYEFSIDTSYHISKTHTISTSSLTNSTSLWDHFVEFEQDYTIVFMVNSRNFANSNTEPSMFDGVDPTYQENMTVIARQKVTINLGHSLDDVIYNRINLEWSSKEYKKYEIDVPLLYDTDVYQTDLNGVPVIEIVDGKVILNKIHSQGDQIYNDIGEPLFKHKIDDLVTDVIGMPIVIGDRIRLYYLQAMMIDAKLYISEHPTQIKYRTSLTNQLEQYFSILRESLSELNERDRIYFKPVRTLGQAPFSIGDDITTTLTLNITIKLRCHVDDATYKDEALRENITQSITEMIERSLITKSISLTTISNEILSKIDFVNAVDVLGICNDSDLQTISLVDESVQPSLAQELYLTKDNKISIKKSAIIEFIKN